MAISEEKKKRLAKVLKALSTPEENQELEKLDAAKVKQIVKAFNDIESEHETKYDELLGSFNKIMGSFEKYQKSVGVHNQSVVELISGMTDSLSKNLQQLSGTLTTSFEQNKPVNAAGVYKDMINQLSEVNQSIKDKPVPVWNWPQYAAVSVRNRNFANIDPAVDPMNIGEYDYVTCALSDGDTTETYHFYQDGAGGTLQATVVIVYASSARTTIVSVTKTPVVTT